MKESIISIIALLILPIALVAQTIKGIDEIGPFSEGLAAVRKGNQWGFINEKGTLVIDFRSDLHWNKDADTSKPDITGVRYPTYKEGKCLVKKMERGITVFGFIHREGKTITEPQFLNVSQFSQGYATGIRFIKMFKGSKEFKLKIYNYGFDDVFVAPTGKIEEFLGTREDIHMNKKRYVLPDIHSRILSKNLVAARIPGQGWEISRLQQ